MADFFARHRSVGTAEGPGTTSIGSAVQP